MKLTIISIILFCFLVSCAELANYQYQDTRKCHYKRIRIYDEKGKYKGYTEERVCEDE